MKLDLDAIQARADDCKSYNFGMRNADKLAREDVPALVEAIRAVLELHKPHLQKWCTGCECMYPCPTVRALSRDVTP